MNLSINQLTRISKICLVICMVFPDVFSYNKVSGEIITHNFIYESDSLYCAFPYLFQDTANDYLWVQFSYNTVRSHSGVRAGGKTGTIVLFSRDGAQTWIKKEEKGFKSLPNRLRHLPIGDTSYLKIGIKKNEKLTKGQVDSLRAKGKLVKKTKFGYWANYRVDYSLVNGESIWDGNTIEFHDASFMYGYGLGIVTRSGVILKQFYGLSSVNSPAYRSWVLRSEDNGRTFQLNTIAFDGKRPFGETDIIQLPDNRIYACIRTKGGICPSYIKVSQNNDLGYIWSTVSNDEGKTWLPPEKTPMWGYPANLLVLKDSTLLCTYGYRRPPYGIRACLSKDNGKIWDIENEIILRDDGLVLGPGKDQGGEGDLGYPKTVELKDGILCTVYYFTVKDKKTFIAATRWHLIK